MGDRGMIPCGLVQQAMSELARAAGRATGSPLVWSQFVPSLEQTCRWTPSLFVEEDGFARGHAIHFP